jgi:hypothetical protein
MPLILRIILQRVFIFILGFLSFLGINPDITPPSPEEVVAFEQASEENIEEALSEKAPLIQEEKEQEIKQKTEEITNEIEEKQLVLQEQVENIINIPKIESKNGGLEIRRNFYEDVVVNIVCVNKGSNFVKMTTGSGVIVSSSGIILTNSHVANTFLFDDKTKSSYKKCTIRRENIPTYGFNAELVYLSKDWLIENQEFFKNENPRGSGENDFALLAITTNTNPALPVPEIFPSVDLILEDNDIDENDNIVVAAYPGMSTGVFEVDSNGKIKIAQTYISELMTFYRNTIDLISTGTNDVAKKGSSGGGVFKNEDLLGVIVTTDTTTEGNYLNAITLPYIANDFRQNVGTNLTSYIKNDKNKLISDYKAEIINLKSLIADFI